MLKKLLIHPILLIFFSSIVLSFGCKKNYECKGYPLGMLAWFPYNIGDTLYYTNITDTIYLVIEAKTVDADDYIVEYNNKDKTDCKRYAAINTNKESKTTFQIYFLSGSYSDIDEMNFAFWIYKDRHIGGVTCGVLWLYLRNGEYSLPVIDTLNLNGYTFTNVVTEETSYKDFISRMWLAKGYGIIKFREASGAEWVLIPDK